MTATHFCLSVTLLDAAFHGRGDDEPEWPPSPLRAFQALRAAAAARGRGRPASDDLPAFEWLEALGPPEIVAPPGEPVPLPHRLYVPNNAGDLVMKAWAGGSFDASMASYREPKDARPTRLVSGDVFTGGTTVRYLWRLPASTPADAAAFAARLAEAARSITHLGWGVDLAAGHAGLLDDSAATAILGDAACERWTPGGHGVTLRVPQAESLAGPSTVRSLDRRYGAFVRRMESGVPRDVPPLAADRFQLVGYGRPTHPPDRPFAAFELWAADSERRCRFNPTYGVRDVAAMVRHAVGGLAVRMRPFGWGDAEIAAFVHGHDPDGGPARGTGAGRRFSYLPLPSLETRGGPGRHASAVNRVLVVAPPGCRDEAAWVRTLSGEELQPLGAIKSGVILQGIAGSRARLRSDRNLGPYVGEASVWSTVTPVLLPGYDDPNGLRKRLRSEEARGNAAAQKALLERLDARVHGLLWKAFLQAGWPPELVDRAELEWRRVGFRPGVDLATRYAPPEDLKRWPRYHVRVRWRDAAGREVPVRGPLAVGAGRHRGFGVFAAE